MPTPTEEQLKRRLTDAGISAASLPPQVNTNAPIDASKIGTSAKITVPVLPTVQTPNYANVAVTTGQTQTTPVTHETTPTLPVIQDTPEQAALKGEQQNIVSTIEADTTKLGGKAARQTQLETDQGLPALNARSNELNDLIRQTQADALNAYNKSEDRQAPTFAITGEQASIERMRAAKIFGYAAAAEAINGKIALADNHVERALAAEFDPIEKEIDNKKFLLQINMDNFSTAEKRRAEAQSQLLDKQKQEAQDAKDAKKDVYSVMLAAAQNGADNATLSKIQQAATPAEAIATAGVALVKPDTQIVNANGRVVMIDSKTGKTIADLGKSDAALSLAAAAARATSTAANKPPTVTQTTYGNYAPRLQSADQTINSLSGKITGMAPVSYAVAQRLPSFLQSGDLQQYNQAKLNFVNAVLRQESGAAISESERKQYEAQYFPVPGDKPATIAQKAANRAQLVQSYVKNAGPAYTGPANDTYADYRSQLQQGEILVQRGDKLIAVTPEELQANDVQL
jgi:hypothetical protein